MTNPTTSIMPQASDPHSGHSTSPGSGSLGERQDPMLAEALAELRDIHLPQAEGWWPPAPGWWILFIIFLASLFLVSLKGIPFARSRWRYRRIKRQVLQQMSTIQDQIPDTQDHKLGTHIIEPLFNLVKRFFLMHSPENRHLIGGLHGHSWLDFLALHGRFDLSKLDADSREMLLSLPYVSPSFWDGLDPEQAKDLRKDAVQLCNELMNWVKGMKIHSLSNLQNPTKPDLPLTVANQPNARTTKGGTA